VPLYRATTTTVEMAALVPEIMDNRHIMLVAAHGSAGGALPVCGIARECFLPTILFFLVTN
jgi:hypothetical protein